MAWNQLDYLFKKSLSRRVTDAAPDKEFYNEFGEFAADITAKEIYVDTIPTGATVVSGITELRTDLVLTEDLSVAGGQTWFARDPNIPAGVVPDGTDTSRLKNWISDKYGPAYTIVLEDSLGNQIFPTDPSEWLFDYKTGILTFNGTAPANPPYQITGYRYIGKTLDQVVSGLTSGSGSTVQTGTLTNSTLRWNGVEWVEATNLTNDGNINSILNLLSSGVDLTSDSVNISGLTSINLSSQTISLDATTIGFFGSSGDVLQSAPSGINEGFQIFQNYGLISAGTIDLVASTTGTSTAITMSQSAITNALQSIDTSNALSGLTDVSFTTPTSGDIIQYNGTNWLNINAAGGFLPAGTTAGQMLRWDNSINEWITADNILAGQNDRYLSVVGSGSGSGPDTTFYASYEETDGFGLELFRELSVGSSTFFTSRYRPDTNTPVDEQIINEIGFGTGPLILRTERQTLAGSTNATNQAFLTFDNFRFFSQIQVGDLNAAATATNGMIRYESNLFQGYQAGAWRNLVTEISQTTGSSTAITMSQSAITEAISIAISGESLPVGTVTGSILTWNGSDWVQNTTLSVTSGGTASATGAQAVAWGVFSNAIGIQSTAWGNNTQAIGDNSVVWGVDTEANGVASTAWGDNSLSSGDYSTAWGINAFAESFVQTTLGQYSLSATALSISNWDWDDQLLKIGNGINTSNRSDALIVYKNATIEIGPARSITSDTALESATTANVGTITNRLYNIGGELYWNGNNLLDSNDISQTTGSSTAITMSQSAITEAISIAISGESLPIGTVTNSILTWNGSDWVQNTTLSVTSGGTASATGVTSMAWGTGTQANGGLSTAWGQDSIANGVVSTAFGAFAEATGNFSTAFGTVVSAESYAQITTGIFSLSASTANPTAFDWDDELFKIGNGNDFTQLSNALVVYKNATIEIGPARSITSDTALESATTANVGTITNRLYNIGGELYWNGQVLATGTGSTISDGTVIGTVLRWDGTDWTENLGLIVNSSSISSSGSNLTLSADSGNAIILNGTNLTADTNELRVSTGINQRGYVATSYVEYSATTNPVDSNANTIFVTTGFTNGMTLTLPADPIDGQIIRFKDKGGASLTNVWNIAPGGATSIEGGNIVVDDNFGLITLQYHSTDLLWYIIS